jgi:hypothetical protein
MVLRGSVATLCPFLAAICAVLCSSAYAQQTCPIFTKKALDGEQPAGNKFATFPGGFVLYAKVLATDTDGASTAYHPDNIGSTHLCNAMNVYRDGKCPKDYDTCYKAVRRAQAVKWNPATSPAFCVFAFEAIGPKVSAKSSKTLWGAGLSNRTLPVQSANDPAPGFFISTTAAPVSSIRGKGVEYADADRLPYLVMPSSLTGATGPTGYRNAGAIVRLKDKHSVYAIVADENKNPAEISVAAAQLIHDPALEASRPITEPELRGETQPPPYPYKWNAEQKRAKVYSSDEGPFLVFALGSKYGRAPNYDADMGKLNTLGENAFAPFGGLTNLSNCAERFFSLGTTR